MRLKKPKKFAAANLFKLKERAQRLDRSELLESLDTGTSLLNRYISEYRRTRHPDLLAETKMTAESIYTLAEELLERDEPSPPIEEEKFPTLHRARQIREHY